MEARHFAIGLLICPLLLLGGCATDPVVEAWHEQIAMEIKAVLDQPIPEELGGEPLRCLSESRYRSHEALDEKHLLFKGQRNRYWINTLAGRCPDLKWSSVLVIRSFSGTSLCERDRFQVTDWFDWPAYRRRPADWGTGVDCILGKFQPVTEDQVERIRILIDRR